MSGRDRNFAQLVAASGLSNLSDGMFQIALPVVALGITRDAGAFASVTLVGRLPWLLFSLQAGALADRLDRRRIMAVVNGARAGVLGVLALAVATDVAELWLLYAVAFGLGIGETLYDTAGQSILPNVVTDPDRLSKANGYLYGVEIGANNFVGPPLGGLIAGVTLAGALASSALAYGMAAGILLLLVGQFRPAREPGAVRIRSDIADGVRYLARHRVLRTLAICVGISNLASTALLSVLPLHAIRPGPLGLTSGGFGLLLATLAAGSVIGTLLVDRLERRIGRRRTLLVATAMFPAYPLVLAMTSSIPWIAATFFVGAALSIGWNVITVSPPAADCPGSAPRPRERRLPAAGVGNDAHRSWTRRVRREPVGPRRRVLDKRGARRPVLPARVRDGHRPCTRRSRISDPPRRDRHQPAALTMRIGGSQAHRYPNWSRPERPGSSVPDPPRDVAAAPGGEANG